ncbi:hypothetical protein M0R88_03510 [Halorussus gelatinilyticus]|uniref:Uncharacterized protein n=1 Tax=Halorussus gelatinilyticus TaxID=2937524 RepID=A0A8U0IJ88_9EURY|nr:hypothetical protein [Halorussus gelatinilyticus]UPW01177.1 hypothetical protein M0R88_03510 [Halorussus gelatinilyticus]
MGDGEDNGHSLGGGDSGISDGHSLDELIPGDRESPSSPHRRVVQWVLLRGKRMWVAAALLLTVLSVLVGGSIVRPLDLQTLLRDTNTVQTLFSALLSGSILLVSIVVSINSIVLSEEITDIETQRERIDASVRYRGQIEEFIESDVSPARPAEFLRTILKVIDRQAEGIESIAERADSDEFAEEAKIFSEEVSKEAEKAGETLSGAKFGSFKVLLAGLDYDYSWQLHVARRFKRKYGHCLGDDQQRAIDDLVETLKVFATGREYFKSLYYKREFSRLSARLLYVSLPTIVYISYVMLVIGTDLFPEVWLFWQPLKITPLSLFTTFSYTVALAPYVVLTSYVLRAMTVTLQTLASGPFVLRQSDELDEFDWDDDVEVAETSVPTPAESEEDDRGEGTPAEGDDEPPEEKVADGDDESGEPTTDDEGDSSDEGESSEEDESRDEDESTDDEAERSEEKPADDD